MEKNCGLLTTQSKMEKNGGSHSAAQLAVDQWLKSVRNIRKQSSRSQERKFYKTSTISAEGGEELRLMRFITTQQSGFTGVAIELMAAQEVKRMHAERASELAGVSDTRSVKKPARKRSCTPKPPASLFRRSPCESPAIHAVPGVN